jgi:hypothetical protein
MAGVRSEDVAGEAASFAGSEDQVGGNQVGGDSANYGAQSPVSTITSDFEPLRKGVEID